MRRTISDLEHLFAQICHNAYPHEWDENHISFMLMRELRNLFSNKVVHFTNFSKLVDWQSFKNRGKQETNYGDIALLVNIQFTSGEVLKGVACLEAKRQFISGAFESLEIQQIERLHNIVPHSHLLLYSYRHLDLPLKFPDDRNHRSHLWVSPLNTVSQLLPQLTYKDNERVFRISFPFAMFLTSRIFWGHDLDYRAEIYNDLVEGNGKLFDASYLGVVNIYYNGQRPVDIELGGSWEKI